MLALLARFAALIRSLARSLDHSGDHGKVIFVYEMNALISYNLKPLCDPTIFVGLDATWTEDVTIFCRYACYDVETRELSHGMKEMYGERKADHIKAR